LVDVKFTDGMTPDVLL